MRVGLLARILVAVAAVFTTIGVVESGFILFDSFTGSLSASRAPDLGRGIRSWTVHHAMRPGYRDGFGQLNSFGLRSPEVAVPKPAGVIRILLLGDSFTFGFKSRDEDVFARQLEARLREESGLGTLEVVNAGVLSYCPLLEYLQYRHHLHILEPDIVVLNFDMSDVQDHMAYMRGAQASPGTRPLFVAEPSLLEQTPSALPGLLSFEWAAAKLRAVKNRLASRAEGVPFFRDEDRYLWALDGGPEMQEEALAAMAPIADLQALLKHHGIPLVLATYPQPWQVATDALRDPGLRQQYGIGLNTVHLNDRPFRLLESFAASQNLPFVNATADFRHQTAAAGLFLNDDFHFSARGNALYAEVLARALRPRLASVQTR